MQEKAKATECRMFKFKSAENKRFTTGCLGTKWHLILRDVKQI